MALTTPPGGVPAQNQPTKEYSPEAMVLKQVTSICKKCIGPKPPRTHHCSVCDNCVLKMDHHCPWLNGCVGHFNHRYFFQYMVYMVTGCLFLMVFGFEILYNELFGEKTTVDPVFSLFSERSMIIYEAFLTTGCFLCLGGLTLWHAKLITNGETSIEAHINVSERKRYLNEKLGKGYVNPYDFGPWRNWCLFFGLVNGRGWGSVFWPSVHPPKGDGLEWDSVYSCDIKWNDYERFKVENTAKMA